MFFKIKQALVRVKAVITCPLMQEADVDVHTSERTLTATTCLTTIGNTSLRGRQQVYRRRTKNTPSTPSVGDRVYLGKI